MNYVAAALAVVLFLLGLRIFQVVPAAAEVFSLTKEAAAILGASDLHDDEKEHAVRKAAKRLVLLFASISVRAGAALAVSWVVLFALDRLKIADMRDVVALFLSWEVILGSTAAFLLMLVVRR